MKIYLTRHGQTDWNVAHKTQGRTDIPLNAAGIQQAETLREEIKDLALAATYTSPLQRAVDTAKIAVGAKCEIIPDDRLRERGFGDFEGEIITTWPALGSCADIDDPNLSEIPGNVETVQNLLARIQDFLDMLQRTHADDAQILVVGHGALAKGFNWLLAEHAEGERFGAFRLGNAEIQEYEI